jgi:chromosome segregation ATPase
MASEPTDDSLSVSLPAELAEWIDQEASDRETDRETVLVQLLAAHRAADEMEDGVEIGSLDGTGGADVEDEVRSVIAERLPDIAGAVADQLEIERQVEDAIEARQSELAERAATRAANDVESDLAALEDEFMGKVEDVRDRVIQVKKETDRKAPAEHDHPNLVDRINSLANDVEAVQDDLGDLRREVEGQLDSQEERLDDLDETVWDVQDKLETVAYVVKDLRDSGQLENKRATSVEKIKRAAAKEDLDRARCEACGEGVEIALMTDPECPHCEATVTDVKPGEGLFGKPMLVKAQGIEPADDES